MPQERALNSEKTRPGRSPLTRILIVILIEISITIASLAAFPPTFGKRDELSKVDNLPGNASPRPGCQTRGSTANLADPVPSCGNRMVKDDGVPLSVIEAVTKIGR